jgi:Zn finger protein HypA/HybF involved in hydrogenase expression
LEYLRKKTTLKEIVNMDDLSVEIYECSGCQLIINVEEHTDIMVCPRCTNDDLTLVGKGIITGIVEY